VLTIDLSGLASGDASLSTNMSSRTPESLLDAPQKMSFSEN
jgi:hypothetical protein